MKERTVFVLGAGSSMAYDFPSGQGLVDKICLELRNTNYGTINQLVDQENGINGESIETFRKTLYYSEAASVDLFLGKNQRYLHVGKRAIAQALSKFESEKTLFNKERKENEEDKHWYRRFFNQLIRSFNMNHPKDAVEKLKDGKITFITFNYDRSLEHYVYQKMRHLYTSWSEQDVAAFVDALNIIHVYGQIGFLEWQNKQPMRPYVSQINSDQLKKFSNTIFVIDEKSDHSDVAQRCRNALLEAKKIVFLGFGYHKENLQLIGINQLIKFENHPVEYLGTSLGMTETEIERTREYFQDRIKLDGKLSIMDLLKKVDFFG